MKIERNIVCSNTVMLVIVAVTIFNSFCVCPCLCVEFAIIVQHSGNQKREIIGTMLLDVCCSLCAMFSKRKCVMTILLVEIICYFKEITDCKLIRILVIEIRKYVFDFSKTLVVMRRLPIHLHSLNNFYRNFTFPFLIVFQTSFI